MPSALPISNARGVVTTTLVECPSSIAIISSTHVQLLQVFQCVDNSLLILRCAATLAIGWIVFGVLVSVCPCCIICCVIAIIVHQRNRRQYQLYSSFGIQLFDCFLLTTMQASLPSMSPPTMVLPRPQQLLTCQCQPTEILNHYLQHLLSTKRH